MILNSGLSAEESEIQHLKTLRFLKKLNLSSGQGTSMISLILPPKDQIYRAIKLLNTELGTATNIKSRTNRLSVLSAINSAILKLKTIKEVPPNGLAVFSGTIMEHKKEKKVTAAIEPIAPINTSLYLCDSKFHVEDLMDQFVDTTKYGVIVMTGQQTIFCELIGNTKTILQTINVDLPKKHGRGGQSSVRFARLRVEKRQAYIRKAAEIANCLYTTNPNSNTNSNTKENRNSEAYYEGLILAGPADFKNELKESNVLKKELYNSILKVVDTNYGGENGLNQAIEMSQDALKNVRYNKEKKVLKLFFDEVSDNAKYCLGARDIIDNLINGTVDTIILYEDLSDDINMKEIIKENFKDSYDLFYNNNSNSNNNICEEEFGEENVVDFFTRVYRKFNVRMTMVSDKTVEGNQFIGAFGGIGAILKFKNFDNADKYCSDDEICSSDIF